MHPHLDIVSNRALTEDGQIAVEPRCWMRSDGDSLRCRAAGEDGGDYLGISAVFPWESHAGRPRLSYVNTLATGFSFLSISRLVGDFQ